MTVIFKLFDLLTRPRRPRRLRFAPMMLAERIERLKRL
jgi:hypothetical protein